ncbi:unnamed protein product [Sphagnum tenellum]
MGSAAAPGPGRPAPKRQSLCGSTVQQRSHAVEVRQGYGMLVIKAGRNSFWNVHKSGSLALAIDPIQNRLWDKGRIYLGEKTSQDFVMPDALPSPVFRNGYEMQKEVKISSAHMCCLDRRDTL